MRYGTGERPNSLGYRNMIRNRFIELTQYNVFYLKFKETFFNWKIIEYCI